MYLTGILPLSILLEIMNPAMDEIVQVFQTPTFYRQAVALLPNGVNNGIRKFTTNETYFFLLLLLFADSSVLKQPGKITWEIPFYPKKASLAFCFGPPSSFLN